MLIVYLFSNPGAQMQLRMIKRPTQLKATTPSSQIALVLTRTTLTPHKIKSWVLWLAFPLRIQTISMVYPDTHPIHPSTGTRQPRRPHLHHLSFQLSHLRLLEVLAWSHPNKSTLVDHHLIRQKRPNLSSITPASTRRRLPSRL